MPGVDEVVEQRRELGDGLRLICVFAPISRPAAFARAQRRAAPWSKRALARRAGDRASPRARRARRRAPPRPAAIPAARRFSVSAAAAGRHRDVHAVRAARAHDLDPVVAQVRLAADERHLARAELGELVDDLERLVGRQLVGPARRRASRSASTRGRRRASAPRRRGPGRSRDSPARGGRAAPAPARSMPCAGSAGFVAAIAALSFSSASLHLGAGAPPLRLRACASRRGRRARCTGGSAPRRAARRSGRGRLPWWPPIDC